MKGHESVVGHWERLQRSATVSGDLGLLAWNAETAKVLDIAGHTAPNITAADIAQCSIAALMYQAMDAMQEGRHKRGWDDRPRGVRTQANIAEEPSRR